MTLKNLRNENKLKIIDVANFLKMQTSTVSQYETGKRQPKIDQLPKLAEVLGCSIEEVVLALIETKKQAQAN